MDVGIEVCSKGYRHPIPDFAPQRLADLIWRCWETDPQARPQFSELYPEMQKLAEEYNIRSD